MIRKGIYKTFTDVKCLKDSLWFAYSFIYISNVKAIKPREESFA